MSHFNLSETQELQLWRARHLLTLFSSLADASPCKAVPLDPEGLSALLNTVAEMIPTYLDMPYEPAGD